MLVDGQRWVPSTIEGLVDVNTIPQSLITGIDVTTGGASAAYGSGAVGGVVNFILDKKFTGVKTDYQYSEYQLYDDPTNKFTLTGGKAFADGRGHALFSGEVFQEQGNLNGIPVFDQNAYFSMPNTAANIAAGRPADPGRAPHGPLDPDTGRPDHLRSSQGHLLRCRWGKRRGQRQPSPTAAR